MPTSTSKKVEEPCEDWEDLDYDDDSVNRDQVSDSNPTSTSTNAMLWTDANQKPQYVIITSNSSTSTSTPSSKPTLPQTAIFGTPTLTILKRKIDPTNQDRSISSSTNLQPDLKSREKDYLEARERIFGSSTSSNSIGRIDQPSNSVAIERQPHGPDDHDSKGFKHRRQLKTK